jgi:hypothetical protein
VRLGCCKRDRRLILVAQLAAGPVAYADAGKTLVVPLFRSEAQSLTDSVFLRQLFDFCPYQKLASC